MEKYKILKSAHIEDLEKLINDSVKDGFALKGELVSHDGYIAALMYKRE